MSLNETRAETPGRTGNVISSWRIAPQTGIAFPLRRGQIVRVTDPEGEQVADFMAFRDGSDGKEWLSSGRSIDYANTIYLTAGHTLYSNDSNPMLKLLRDDVGRHDFLLTPCSPETFQIIYGEQNYHPSCYENLWRSFAPHGIAPHQIPTTLNIFMNVAVDAATGMLTIGPPLSKPGDCLEMQAEMDLIVGVTACSAEMSNNYRFKPIEVTVLEYSSLPLSLPEE